MTKPTTAEFNCYKALGQLLHLEHKLAKAINDEDYDNAFQHIEKAYDSLSETVVILEAHHEAKTSKPIKP